MLRVYSYTCNRSEHICTALLFFAMFTFCPSASPSSYRINVHLNFKIDDPLKLWFEIYGCKISTSIWDCPAALREEKMKNRKTNSSISSGIWSVYNRWLWNTIDRHNYKTSQISPSECIINAHTASNKPCFKESLRYLWKGVICVQFPS